ncbi:hypothetical protein ALC56_07845 [Trachymyrmex septentrionalis]|uniref:Uncharacterized protein n=1 Tax=Trachymyrmex septentrionalis TaxID=34720 RepID=A0A195FB88_9HYME|nr:hypothetical protein ALC56_07845 [Trachymyrmex septentrionalis]
MFALHVIHPRVRLRKIIDKVLRLESFYSGVYVHMLLTWQDVTLERSTWAD